MKFIAEIVIEESENTCTLNLVQDVMDALVSFKEENLAWREVESVSIDGIRSSQRRKEDK